MEERGAELIMGGHDVRIEQDEHRRTQVFIDGKKIENVFYVNYEHDASELPVVTIKFYPGTLNIAKK